MLIRGATIDDACAIAAIHVAGWRAAYRGIMPDALLADLSVDKRAANWRFAIEQRRPQILVAAEPNRIVGWIAFGKCRDADQSADTGEIWAVYACPDRWSRGVGRSLWLAARAALVAEGFSRITLWVLAANERACRFYERAGFAEDRRSRKPAEFGGVALDEIRLVYDVAGQPGIQSESA